MSINPHSDKDFIRDVDIHDSTKYPKFLHSIKFETFRQITNLKIDFLNPITILSGTNKIGKTTILMAIACSHFNFQKRNPVNGNLERYTWSNFIRMTAFDQQKSDWTYWISFREGIKLNNKRGQRKFLTKKWNGIAKKESQITKRQVIYIDVDRVNPAKYNTSLVRKLKSTPTSTNVNSQIQQYLSYIFETSYTNMQKLTEHNDKELFSYQAGTAKYSGFNSASGEDVITKILKDSVEAERYALILIDEIEIGLHPKVQRKLLDVLNYISREDKKQFIITTHSPSIFQHVNSNSRIFINKNSNNEFICVNRANVNESLSHMDSELYPLVNLYCEDDIAKNIILDSINDICHELTFINIFKLINIIISGPASDTYDNFKVSKRIYKHTKIKTGYLCILDGDQKDSFPNENGLFFLFGILCPEKLLVQKYLNIHPHENLQYHCDHSNCHALFQKMIEFDIASTRNHAFLLCWENFKNTYHEEYHIFLQELKYFLGTNLSYFSRI